MMGMGYNANPKFAIMKFLLSILLISCAALAKSQVTVAVAYMHPSTSSCEKGSSIYFSAVDYSIVDACSKNNTRTAKEIKELATTKAQDKYADAKIKLFSSPTCKTAVIIKYQINKGGNCLVLQMKAGFGNTVDEAKKDAERKMKLSLASAQYEVVGVHQY